jgi:hypothetical protein
MSAKAVITINRPRGEVERRWREHQPACAADATVAFLDAPGDRGTEIHVDVGKDSSTRRAKAQDDLRHFKALVETGVLPVSDAVPEGERFERKLRQRPAQPVEEVSA